MFTVVYVLCTIVLIFFEGIAIGRPGRHDTISEHVWASRSTLLVLLLAPLWFWMTGHFWYWNEPDGLLWNDALYVLVGVVVGFVNYQALRRNS